MISEVAVSLILPLLTLELLAIILVMLVIIGVEDILRAR